MLRVLGQGTFATVALAVKRDTGVHYAMKSLNKRLLVERFQVRRYCRVW